MTLRATLLLAAGALAAVTAVLLATHEWGPGQGDDGQPAYPYLLEDVHDRGVYQQRGRWLPSGRTPYLLEHSEYPQLATWAFALPYLFIDHTVAWAPDEPLPKGAAQRDQLLADKDAYFDAFHVMMALGMLGLILFTALGLRTLGHPPGLALLLLLPASVYFGFNRFDAMPAAVATAGVWLQLSGRRRWAALVLGLGAMTKWYPILLLPLCASYNLHADRAAARRRGQDPGWVGPLVSGALVPGLIAGGVCLALFAVTWFWDGGGWEAVKYPYAHHGKRGANMSSVVAALTLPERWGWFDLSQREAVSKVFTLLQFLPAALLALVPVRDTRSLRWGLLTVVIGFVWFSKVHSPQWVLWIAPLALLLGHEARRALVLLIVLDLLLYLQNPVLYYSGLEVGPRGVTRSDAFLTVCDVRIAWMFLFWLVALGSFLWSAWRPLAEDPAPPGGRPLRLDGPDHASPGDASPAPAAPTPAPAGPETQP